MSFPKWYGYNESILFNQKFIKYNYSQRIK